MKRNNFYILLDLSLDPPEEDPKKIEAALSKKQDEWNKLLNHPEKGIQAKLFISLIPEIQKVMADPDLRKKEAIGAKILLEKKDQRKFQEIDRQLSIFLSKGTVTSREIQKLVKLHSIETDEILKWMLKKEKEAASQIPAGKPSLNKEGKLKIILSNLGIRMRKGYILDEEISRLAKQNKVDKQEILKQIRYPVRSKKDGAPKKPKTIDPYVLKDIRVNLGIVGKSTLYEFLNLSAGSNLAELENYSKKKRTEMMKLPRKDTKVKAGITLSGYCLKIFSDEETRIAYDTALARHFIESLNSDIGIAEEDGVVRTEYFEAIASNAVKSGMDYEDACNHIEAYCRKNHWKAKSKRKQKQRLLTGAAVVALVLLISIGSVAVVSNLKTKRLSKEYEDVMAKVKVQQKFEKKKQVLTEYVKSHDKSAFTEKAEKEIQNLTHKIIMRNSNDERDYKAALASAASENESRNYEKIGTIFETYLKNHSDGIHADELRKKRSELPSLIDNRDFQAISAISKEDTEKILEACALYLTGHPHGSHRTEVAAMMAEMEKPYYDLIKNKITTSEKNKNWKDCIDLCERYVKYFPNGQYLNELKGEQYFFSNQLKNRIELENLIRQAEQTSDSSGSAQKIYSDYLKANPNSPIKQDVIRRLKNISKKKNL